MSRSMTLGDWACPLSVKPDYYNTRDLTSLHQEIEKLCQDYDTLRAQLARNEDIAMARHNNLVNMIKGLCQTTPPPRSSLAQFPPPATAFVDSP
ncbi:hypothetical protein HAX54_031565 [Datura stramonium]|uniref:Uncharacterized protein n=1 Tax=Datura stramonium TaxID=4076 RepID=A0ABS8RMP3_DATST|nr:hypothetical protein [Datura stramonium]